MAVKNKHKALIILLLLIVIGVIFSVFFVQVTQMESNEVAVKVGLGDSNVEVVSGDVVYMPLRTQLYVYPTIIRTKSFDSIVFILKDGVQFQFSPSISYRLDPAKADLFYRRCGTSLSVAERGPLKEFVKTAFLDAANGFTTDSLMYNKQTFEKTANERLSGLLNNVGLVLESSNSNMVVPNIIQDIVTLRAKALQEALIVESSLRESEAQRKSDSLQYSVLTPLAIQKMFIDKWDGKLNGNDVTPIFTKK